jgi:4-hydroxy-3-polyprenylbenzoate decarboxylase
MAESATACCAGGSAARTPPGDMRCSAISSATVQRVASAMGLNDFEDANPANCSRFEEPEPPQGLRDLWDRFHSSAGAEHESGALRALLSGSGAGRQGRGLARCRCRPAGRAMPARSSWGLTVTRGPASPAGLIYRQQVIGRNKLIMRWLAHRGALDYQDH